MTEKSNFSIIPNWLVSELRTAKEFQAYCGMYNGWCLMKDADGWYYRSISKLKEDFGMNPDCSCARVTKIIKRFEELGILHIKSNGKGTKWYKFDEVVLFNHIEEGRVQVVPKQEDEGRVQVVPKQEDEGRVQVVPKGRVQVVPKQDETVGNKLYLIYNTEEKNQRENTQSTQCISHVPASDDTMNVETLSEVEEKHECETADAFDPSQHSDIAAMVHADAGVSVRCDEDKAKYAERNAWISKLFNKLQVNLDALSKCYDKRLVAGKDGYADTLSKLIGSADSKIEAGWFTERQVNKLNGYIKRYNGLMRDRCERFGLQDTASLTSEGDSGSGSERECHAPTTAVPNFTEEEYQHALQEVFSTWDKWTYLSRVGFGLQDHKQQVADNLNADVNLIDHAKFEADVRKMFIA